jgi:hypothetical protein
MDFNWIKEDPSGSTWRLLKHPPHSLLPRQKYLSKKEIHTTFLFEPIS